MKTRWKVKQVNLFDRLKELAKKVDFEKLKNRLRNVICSSVKGMRGCDIDIVEEKKGVGTPVLPPNTKVAVRDAGGSFPTPPGTCA